MDRYNITCGVRVMKTSDCHVTEIRYVIPLLGYLFEVAITARSSSNVPGARNGTIFSKQGMRSQTCCCLSVKFIIIINHSYMHTFTYS